MEATRYTFFLDEMIKRRNKFIVTELERKRHSPFRIPKDVLLQEDSDSSSSDESSSSDVSSSDDSSSSESKSSNSSKSESSSD